MPQIKDAEQIFTLDLNSTYPIGEMIAFPVISTYTVLAYATDHSNGNDYITLDLLKHPQDAQFNFDFNSVERTYSIELNLGTSLSLNSSFQPFYYFKIYPIGGNYGQFLAIYSADGEETFAYWTFSIGNNQIVVQAGPTFRTWPMQFGTTGFNHTTKTVPMVRNFNDVVFVAMQGEVGTGPNDRDPLYLYGVQADFTNPTTPSFGSVRTKTIGDHRYIDGIGSGVPLDSNYLMYETSIVTGSGFGQGTRRQVIWNWSADTVAYTDSVNNVLSLTHGGFNTYDRLGGPYVPVTGQNKLYISSSRGAPEISNSLTNGFEISWITFSAPSTITKNYSFGYRSYSLASIDQTQLQLAVFAVDNYDDEGENSSGLHLRLYNMSGEYVEKIRFDIDPNMWNDKAFCMLTSTRFVLVDYDQGTNQYQVRLYRTQDAPGPYVVKFAANDSSWGTFAGSSTAGDEDGPAYAAKFEMLDEISVLSGGPQRNPIIPNTNRWYVIDSDKVKLIHPCQEDIIVGSQYWIPLYGKHAGDNEEPEFWEEFTGLASISFVLSESEGIPELDDKRAWKIDVGNSNNMYGFISQQEFTATPGAIMQMQGNRYRTVSPQGGSLNIYDSQYFNMDLIDWDYYVSNINFSTYVGTVPLNTWIWGGTMFKMPASGKYRLLITGVDGALGPSYLDNYYVGSEDIILHYESNFSSDTDGWTGVSGSSVAAETKDGRPALKITKAGTSGAIRKTFITIPGQLMYIEFDYWEEVGPPTDYVGISYGETGSSIGTSSVRGQNTGSQWYNYSHGRQTHTIEPEDTWSNTSVTLNVNYPSGQGKSWISNIKAYYAYKRPNSGDAIGYPY